MLLPFYLGAGGEEQVHFDIWLVELHERFREKQRLLPLFEIET